MKPSRVTDHAVLRYLEHVAGLDVETVRRHIAAQLKGAPDCATGYRLGGIYFVMDEGRVITVKTHNLPEPRPILFPKKGPAG